MLNIVVCGDLCARRPGRATRNHPLPAEGQRHGAISISHRERFGAIFARQVVPVRRAVRASTMAVHTMGRFLNRDRKSARISFLGSARVQACKQSSRCFANRFHVQNSLSDAHASCLQNDRSDLECPTKALKRLTR